jgi:hypothetical protein
VEEIIVLVTVGPMYWRQTMVALGYQWILPCWHWNGHVQLALGKPHYCHKDAK